MLTKLKQIISSPIWLRAGGYIGRLISFLLFSTMLLVVTFLVSFNILLPGTFFKLPVLLGLILLPFAVSYILVSMPSRKKPEKSIKHEKLSKKSRNALIAMMVVFILAMSGIYLYQKADENKHLTNAQQEFSLTLVDGVSQNRVDSTLIELDAQLARLKKLYGPLVGEQKIGVVLYPDINSLQIHNDVAKWADAYISYSSGKPVIYLPAEQPPSDSSRKANAMASPMPGHELTHYVIREILGENNKGNIPLWFNEGVAQYESFKGFNRMFDRIGCKIGLWLINLVNPKILADGELVLTSSNYPNEHIDEFYIASLEFTDFIASNYGGIKNILYDVSNGMQFSIAFEKETGKTVKDVYLEWYAAFF
ncbi:hypothetical protein DA01_02960 [Dehalococcoides mccartyi]|uniref:Peptidase MA-like domain-containing protein n=1 Tax=Dehalococcoides mccartyi TaxID=61435 RepID=A0A0V8M404_9CHLR|nr:hypothetical protein [Dehalococcoides mccartyi]KSV18486.1 hypothetical protein DA01_02960 [Dehalococcoides mccartyi]